MSVRCEVSQQLLLERKSIRVLSVLMCPDIVVFTASSSRRRRTFCLSLADRARAVDGKASRDFVVGYYILHISCLLAVSSYHTIVNSLAATTLSCCHFRGVMANASAQTLLPSRFVYSNQLVASISVIHCLQIK